MTMLLSNGTSVEAATVGDEGMLGMEAFLSDDTTMASGDTLMQSRTPAVKSSASKTSGVNSHSAAHCTI